MHRLTCIVLSLALCSLGTGGCSSHQPAFVFNPPPPPTPSVVETDFPAAVSILQGFDLAPAREQWNIGDQVLMGIRAVKPAAKGGTTTRYLLVELTNEMSRRPLVFVSKDAQRGPYRLESPVARTRLTLFDENGAQIDDAQGRFATRFLGCGVFDGAAVYADHPELQAPNLISKETPPMSDAEFDQSMRGWLTLMAFSGSMNKKGMFKAMLEGVIARPTWLAMIFNPSIALTFNDGTWPAREGLWMPDDASGSGVSSIRLPLKMVIAGKTAMLGVIRCAEPVAPLSLCGGLTSAKGWNGDDPNIRIEIQLLAAKRGTGGQMFAEPPKPPESSTP